MDTNRVLLADDHPLVREGLKSAIGVRCPVLKVDAVASIAEAEAMVHHRKSYQLMLLDYHMPDSNGFSGFFRMQHILGHTPITMISAHQDPALVTAAKAVGAAGFLYKSQPLDMLASNIEALLGGHTVFPPSNDMSPDVTVLGQRIKSLTTAQMRVLAALARGHLNKQIASDLHLSEATIKTHLTAIFRKLGVHNRLQTMIAVSPLFTEDHQQ